jgi:hypothetical protein
VSCPNSVCSLLTFFSLLVPLCHKLPSSPPPVSSLSQTPTLLPELVQTFVLQKLKEKGSSAPKPPKSASDWYHQPPLTGLNKSPDLTISDVFLNEQSIQGPDAPTSLQPAWEGDPLELRITGNFENKKDKDLKLKTFLFTLEPSVRVRSMAPNETEPVARILLDDAILLTPLAVSDSIRTHLPHPPLRTAARCRCLYHPQ